MLDRLTPRERSRLNQAFLDQIVQSVRDNDPDFLVRFLELKPDQQLARLRLMIQPTKDRRTAERDKKQAQADAFNTELTDLDEIGRKLQ